jgi:hypothetical protein
LFDTEEPSYSENHYQHRNGIQVLEAQPNEYFPPQIVSVSPPRNSESQGWKQNSTLHSEAVHDTGIATFAHDTLDHVNANRLLEEPSGDYFELRREVMQEPPAIPREDQAVQQESLPYSAVLRELGDLPLTQGHDGHKTESHAVEEISKSEVEPQAITDPLPNLYMKI